MPDTDATGTQPEEKLGDIWERRKQQQQAKVVGASGKTPGTAASSMTEAASAPNPVPLPTDTKSTTAIPAMGVTAPVSPTATTSPPKSSTAAGPIGSDGQSSTGWTESPLSLVERGSPVFEHLELTALPSPLRDKIEALARGRSEPTWAVIQQIAEYYIENEGEQCEWPLVDALQCYIDNELIG